MTHGTFSVLYVFLSVGTEFIHIWLVSNKKFNISMDRDRRQKKFMTLGFYAEYFETRLTICGRLQEFYVQRPSEMEQYSYSGKIPFFGEKCFTLVEKFS